MDPNHLYYLQITKIAYELEKASIAYCFMGTSAMLVAGINAVPIDALEISIQWDLLPTAYERFSSSLVTSIEETLEQASFLMKREGILIRVFCYYNTVVEADPDRTYQVIDGQRIWYKSLDTLKRSLDTQDPRAVQI